MDLLLKKKKKGMGKEKKGSLVNTQEQEGQEWRDMLRSDRQCVLRGSRSSPFALDHFSPFGCIRAVKGVFFFKKNTLFKSEPFKILLDNSDVLKWTELIRSKWTRSEPVQRKRGGKSGRQKERFWTIIREKNKERK